MVKVRFAPSPTGIPHVGNIRTALFDYFLAKNQNGLFILRLEDTDQSRKVEGAEEAIKESLMWLGASWDEFSVQSERLDDYKKHAEDLVSKGLAREEEGAIRFNTGDTGVVAWTDAIGNKEISYETQNIEDFIILKADGYPTYHFANVIDDHYMGITHVIRGEEWIPSTPKHILLYKAFDWDHPIFAHVPNVMGTDGKKLSKRRGAKSVLDIKKEGILPAALMNYLMLLGWSPKDDREILTKDEIVSSFSLDKVNSSPAIFDERKLLWMNGEYIRMTSNQELLKLLLDFDPELLDYDQDLLGKLIEPAKTRIKTLADFKGLINPYFNTVSNGTELLSKYWESLFKIDISKWDSSNISNATVSFMQGQNIKYSQIYSDLTNRPNGLPLGDVFEILGKEATEKLFRK